MHTKARRLKNCCIRHFSDHANATLSGSAINDQGRLSGPDDACLANICGNDACLGLSPGTSLLDLPRKQALWSNARVARVNVSNINADANIWVKALTRAAY